MAGPNPWGSRGYEWKTESPPPVHNFHEKPEYPYGPHDHPVPEKAMAEARAHGA